MAAAFKPRLGNVLAGILPGDQPALPGTRMPGEMGFPDMTPGQGMGQPAPKGGFFKEGGMGRTIAGLIGDALLQQADMAPVYAPAMRQRQNMAAEEAQWSRRREADNQDWRAREQWKLANEKPDVPPILRDAMAWQNMSEDQRKAYTAMQEAQRGPITMLPNGMAYVRDPALAAQIGMPAASAPAAPVGKLTPLDGGPTPPASGRFPYR